MARRINLLSKRERKSLARNLWQTRAQQVEEAAEILEDVFNAFLQELAENSGGSELRSAGLGGWVLEVERGDAVTFKGTAVKSLTAYVDHPVFNILDEGREDKIFYAADYGHKAWPMVTPRRTDFGSNPVTTPDTLDVGQGSSDKEIIFRPYFRGGLLARNYTRQLYEKAQAEINRRGIPIILELRDI